MSRISLLTDFGTRDGFIGAVKGVIQEIFPGVGMDDVAHDLPRGDIDSGARALARYWRLWPAGTIHLAVVDPGVGSDRRAVVVRADRRFIVAPDNGIVTPVLEMAETWEAVEITSSRYTLEDPSRTFHGRDIFAPVAAYLARGVHFLQFGARIEDLVRLPVPEPEISDGEVVGEVISMDRFGNLITNIPDEAVAEGARVELLGESIPVGRSYSEVPPRATVALGNSEGRLEVAARDDSAERLLGAKVGTRVKVILP
jgi:S-adenosyl-L-methionine hydrolase (adenosine-forming)